MKNRIAEAKNWISTIPVEQLAEKVKEAKSKYKDKVPQKRLQLIRNNNDLSKEQKLLLESRLYLITMYLEEHPKQE